MRRISRPKIEQYEDSREKGKIRSFIIWVLRQKILNIWMEESTCET
jgi:hypothetical protein